MGMRFLTYPGLSGTHGEVWVMSARVKGLVISHGPHVLINAAHTKIPKQYFLHPTLTN